jgi:hypothetical protein
VVLRIILGPKGNGVTEEWINLYKEKLRSLYSSSVIRMIKLRRMRRVGHVARMARKATLCVAAMKDRKRDATRKTKT